MNKKLPPHKMTDQEKIPQINLRKLLKILKTESGLANYRVFGHGEHTVIVLPDVRQEFNTYFKYGQGYRAVNRDEQKAVIYGHRFIDEKGKYVFLLTRAAYIYPAVQQRTFVATSGDNADDFMEHRLRLEQATVNKYEAQYNLDKKGNVVDIGVKYFGPSKRVGEIHTHPGFCCSFSPTDRASNESTPTVPYTYVVCDPIGEDYRAMVGVEGAPAKIVFLDAGSKKISPKDWGDEDACTGNKGEVTISQVAAVCRSYLKKPGVRGKFRMFYDSKGRAHIKFNARFVCSCDAAEEFELAKNEDAR